MTCKQACRQRPTLIQANKCLTTCRLGWPKTRAAEDQEPSKTEAAKTQGPKDQSGRGPKAVEDLTKARQMQRHKIQKVIMAFMQSRTQMNAIKRASKQSLTQTTKQATKRAGKQSTNQ